MALPTFAAIAIPGIGVPVLTSWVSGDIKFGKGRKISEDSIRKITLGAIAGICVAAATYILTKPAETTGTGIVITPPSYTPKTSSQIKLASPVGVGNWASEPLYEFYSGTGKYPGTGDAGHIYVD